MKTIRMFFVAMMAILSLSPVNPAFAQNYPEKPIRLVVGFGTGGPTDLVARAIADSFRKQFNNSVVIVENRPGASGLIA
ncbi:MAG: hypothetical protein AB7S98_13550, partial [Burkholderiaceae bacterium]